MTETAAARTLAEQLRHDAARHDADQRLLAERARALIAAGVLTESQACDALGVSRATLYRRSSERLRDTTDPPCPAANVSPPGTVSSASQVGPRPDTATPTSDHDRQEYP